MGTMVVSSADSLTIYSLLTVFAIPALVEAHVTESTRYCSNNSTATWAQAVRNCTAIGGELVSARLQDITLSTIDVLFLNASLNLIQGDDVWIGNYIDYESCSLTGFPGAQRKCTDSKLCGAIKISHWSSQTQLDPYYRKREFRYFNCSTQLPYICGRSFRKGPTKVKVVKIHYTWTLACNDCGVQGDSLLYYPEDRKLWATDENADVSLSQWYWINEVVEPVWYSVTETYPEIGRKPDMCGSLSYNSSNPVKSDCNGMKRYACAFNLAPSLPHRFDWECRMAIMPITGKMTSARIPSNSVTTVDTTPFVPPTSSKRETTSVAVPGSTDYNTTFTGNGVSQSITPYSANDEQLNESPQNTTEPGLYIGIGVGLLCLVTVILTVVVVLLRRIRARPRQRAEDYVDFTKKTKDSSSTSRVNMAYDSNHEFGQVRPDPTHCVPDDYSQPFDQAVLHRDQNPREDVSSDALYSFAQSVDQDKLENSGDYAEVRKDTDTCTDRNQDEYGSYDHIGQVNTRNAGKASQSDNTYDKLQCDGNNEYGTTTNRKPELAVVDDVYDHVTKEEDSVYSSTSAPNRATRDPLYDHT